MAEVLSEIPKGRVRNASKYDQYFDGQPWRLTSPDLNGQSAAAIRNYIVSMAKRRGIRVRTVVRSAENTLYIQAEK